MGGKDSKPQDAAGAPRASSPRAEAGAAPLPRPRPRPRRPRPSPPRRPIRPRRRRRPRRPPSRSPSPGPPPSPAPSVTPRTCVSPSPRTTPRRSSASSPPRRAIPPCTRWRARCVRRPTRSPPTAAPRTFPLYLLPPRVAHRTHTPRPLLRPQSFEAEIEKGVNVGATGALRYSACPRLPTPPPPPPSDRSVSPPDEAKTSLVGWRPLAHFFFDVSPPPLFLILSLFLSLRSRDQGRCCRDPLPRRDRPRPRGAD